MRATFRKGCVATLPFLLSMFVPCSPAQQTTSGQEPLKELSLEELGNIEVTSKSKAPELVRKTAAAIFVITQEDIRRSGATSIPEALRLAPGVEVARISSDKWSIGIRGFGSRLCRNVLVLIDGRSVYTTLLAGTYWEVQDTVMEDIDRIEVIRGPGGTVWGPNAVDGVINIITKNSKDTQGTQVTAGGGNEEQGFASARYGGTTRSGFSYRIYGKGFNRGPEFHSDNANYDPWAALQGGFRTDWVYNERDAFTVQGDIYDERAGERVQLVNYAQPYTQNVDKSAVLSGGNILGRWTRTFRDGEDIQVQAFYDHTNRHEPNFGDVRNTFDVDFLQRFYAGSRNHFSWGLGYRASHGDEEQLTTGLYFSPSPRTDQLLTSFIQDTISLYPNRLSLELGTKLIHTNYTGVDAEPSGRLLWTPNDTQTVWLAVTRAVRTPSDAERDFFLTGHIGTDPTTGLPFFARFNGNPHFRSETLNGYEIGYRSLLTGTFYVDVTGFFNQFYNQLSEDITGPAFIENTPPPTHLLLPAQFGNGLEGTTIGGEIAPEWRPTNFWRLRGSYSFLHMALRKGPNSMDVGTAGFINGSSPQHQLMVQSSFDLPKHFTFDVDCRYISALPSLKVQSYSTANVRLAWNATAHWEFSVVGDNLFQPSHIEFPSDPGPAVGIRRSYYGKLMWTSKEMR